MYWSTLSILFASSSSAQKLHSHSMGYKIPTQDAWENLGPLLSCECLHPYLPVSLSFATSAVWRRTRNFALFPTVPVLLRLDFGIPRTLLVKLEAIWAKRMAARYPCIVFIFLFIHALSFILLAIAVKIGKEMFIALNFGRQTYNLG